MPRALPRIAQIDSELGFSGGEVQVFLELAALRERGYSQVLIAPPGSQSARRAAQEGFPVVEVPMRFDLDLPAVFRLRRALRGIDLVHVHTARSGWLAGLAAWSLGIPCVMTRRMDRRVRRNPRTWLVYQRFCQRTAAISPAVRDCLLAGGVPAERIDLVPEAADPARLQPTRGRAATRQALGLADGTVVVLIMAALVRRKGHDVLLEAFAQLRGDVVLLCAGAGPELAALQAQAQRLGVAERVRFLGQRTDPGDLLAACDVFALPSRAEGLGVAALEALGAGRPVVASRVGGLAEVVVDGRCGLLVPPEDPMALAAALRRLASEPDLRDRLGAAGPGRLDEGYRVAQMADHYERIFARVLAEQRR
jgi:glycosyltransferase involved in cell wall biosynthesis